MFITISNLYPRPDQPTRGLYNFYSFREMAAAIGIQNPESRIQNICLVPEWRIWRWPAIRRWKAPEQTPDHRPPTIDLSRALGGRGLSEPQPKDVSHKVRPPEKANVDGLMSVVYLPVFYLPFIGRSLNWWFYYRALRDQPMDLSGALGGRGLSEPQPKDGSHKVRPPEPSNVYGLMSKVSSPPVILVPWLYPDGVAVARAIRGNGSRLWLMALGSDTFHLKSRMRRQKILEACEQAEGIVCVAQVLADRLADAGVPREKLHVVPNGVDTSLFRVRDKSETLDLRPKTVDLSGALGGRGLSEPQTKDGSREVRPPVESHVYGLGSMVSSPKILFVGNLVPVKGPDVLLRAFAALRETIDLRPKTVDLSGALGGRGLSEPQTKDGSREVRPPEESNVYGLRSMVSSPSLFLIGSGPMRAQLERLAAELGIADRVHFLGRRSREEVALWMNKADVLVLSSRSEGMPNVVLEARASGLPVVATPAGAILELLMDKTHFLVVKSCSPEDLAEGLQDMLGRDLSIRKPDPAIPSWAQQAGEILQLLKVSPVA